MPELDGPGAGVVVEEDAPPDGVDVDRRHVDGGKHVLEHGGHQRDVPLFLSAGLVEPIEDEEGGVDELFVVGHLPLQRRPDVSGKGVVGHPERQRWSAREPKINILSLIFSSFQLCTVNHKVFLAFSYYNSRSPKTQTQDFLLKTKYIVVHKLKNLGIQGENLGPNFL